MKMRRTGNGVCVIRKTSSKSRESREKVVRRRTECEGGPRRRVNEGCERRISKTLWSKRTTAETHLKPGPTRAYPPAGGRRTGS
jgi:hypothetical protein